MIRKGQEPTCPWFVADAECNYCFWKFINDRGNGRSLPPAKVASLLMMDDSEVAKITNEGRKLLQTAVDMSGDSSIVIDIKDDSTQ